jgi:adenine deaminase
MAENGEVKSDLKRDLAKIALVERHRATGKIMVGLVNGFEFTRKCAIGSTVAHDSHHMLVVGTDDASMAIAANELAKCGGGQIVVMDGKVIGQVDLQIAGLMSNERADVVAKKAGTVLEGFKFCGCEFNNPIACSIVIKFPALLDPLLPNPTPPPASLIADAIFLRVGLDIERLFITPSPPSSCPNWVLIPP